MIFFFCAADELDSRWDLVKVKRDAMHDDDEAIEGV